MTEFTAPPPEMIQEAWEETHGAFYEFEAIATHFARWGWEQRGAANEAAVEGMGVFAP